MKHPHLNFLTSNIILDGRALNSIRLTYETKNDLYDIIMVMNGDKYLELFQENGKFKGGLPVKALEKILKFYIPLKESFEAYLSPYNETLFEGDTLNKNQLWWKIKEKVQNMNDSIQNPKKKNKLKR